MTDARLPPTAPVVPSEQHAAPPTAPTGAVYQPKRSWPMVIGIIGLVFAGLGLLAGASSLLSLAMPRANPSTPPEGPWWTVSLVTAIVSLSLIALLTTGSILLIIHRPLAPRCMRLWSVLKLMIVFVSAVSVYFVTRDAMAQQMLTTGGPAATGPAAGFIVQGMPLVSAAFTVGFGLPWPLFVLIWFSRPSILNESQSWAVKPGRPAGDDD